MDHFKYAFIDGNWLLHRNFCAMGGRGAEKVPEAFAEGLVSSFLSSVMKITQDFIIEKIILLWDTPPYHKQTLLNGDYKSGRYYMTEEEAREIEDPIEQEKALIDAYNFSQRSKAKTLIKSLSTIALPSIFRQGYEADDLAYLLGKRCSENQESVLMISIDSDWDFWLSDGCIKYNPNKEIMTTYEQVRTNNNIPAYMSLFRYKQLYDSFYGSHNDLVQTVTDEVWNCNVNELFQRFENEGYDTGIFSDPNLARAQMKTFDFEDYQDHKYIELMYESLSVLGAVPSLSKIAQEGTRIKSYINVNSFRHYLSTLNQKLFQE